jgi:hypothetical protein
MKIRLQVTLPQGQPFAFEHPGPTCHIGRDPAAELPLQNAELVSWRHARIELGKDGAWLTDLESSNGTFLNGKRLDRRSPLKAGDQVQLGQTGPRLAVTELDTGARAPAPAPAAPQPAAPRVKSAGTGRASAGNLVLTACGLCLGLALVLAFVAWRQGAQLGGLQREVAELTARVEDMSRDKHLELSRQIAELSEKMVQDGGDKNSEFNKQLNELTNTITRAIDQARQAPALPEKPPDGPAPDSPPPAETPKPADSPSGRVVAAGKLMPVADAGPPMLLERADDKAPWKLVHVGGKIETGRPLCNLPDSRPLLSLDGGVDLWLWGDSQVQEPLAILDTGVVLHAPGEGVDAELTLRRGRVVVANRKEKGPAVVRLRAHGRTWDVKLPDRQSAAGVTVRTGHAFGVPFRPEGADEAPWTMVSFYAQGDTYLHPWKDEPLVVDEDRFLQVNRTDALAEEWPELGQFWSKTPAKRPAQKVAEMQEVVGAMQQGQGTAADTLARQRQAAKSPYGKALCLLALAALDEPGALLEALADTREAPQLRGVGLLALRAWTGREPGQGRTLYRHLQDRLGWSASDALDFLTLLYGYPEDRLADPKTYETLLSLLRSKRPALRQLAVWQLALLAPAESRQVKADIGTPDTLSAEWNKLLPKGQVPQQFRKEEK